MKSAVSSELERSGFVLHFEPFESPFERINWNRYRPDIFGVAAERAELRIVVAECETEPNVRRISNKTQKIRKWLRFQKKLNEEHDFCFLLAIPSGKLKKVNTIAVRRFWDIWILNNKGSILHKIPHASNP